MPTVTTTTTSSGPSGGTVTTTTTETTAVAGVIAPPRKWPSLEDQNAGIFEVREYYCDTSTFDAGEDGVGVGRSWTNDYAKWVTEFGEIASTLCDIVSCFWKIPGADMQTQISGPGSRLQGATEEDAFEKSYPNHSVVVHWIARWDNMEHMQQGWGQVFKNEKMMNLLGRHPLIKHFTRMEARYMTSVLPIQRFVLKSKVYETRRYTFDETVAPWTAETRQQYADWAITLFRGPEGTGGPTTKMKAIYLFVAQVPAITNTVCGVELMGGEKYSVEGFTTPHVSWCAEWDSVKQAQDFYASVFGGSDEASLNAIRHPAGGITNPYDTSAVPFNGYVKISTTFMTAPNIPHKILDM